MTIKYLSINNNSIDLSNIVSIQDGRIFANSNFIIQTDKIKGNNNTESLYYSLAIVDKNGIENRNSFGKFETNINLDYVKSQMSVYQNIKDSTVCQVIGIQSNNDGSFHTSCYTPLPSSNTSEIATTKWVRDLLSSKGL